jgi:beta-lactamase regulating signal transducer with metallopeptidase domain
MDEFVSIILLTFLVIFTFLFVRAVESYEDPKTKEIHQRLIQVDIRAKKISIKGSNQSFTEDKTRTYLCLRDEAGNYYDDNMLMYVALHELAHAISKSVDVEHKTDEFKNNFKMLLAKAESLGFYDPKKPLNYNYCPKTDAITATNSKDAK